MFTLRTISKEKVQSNQILGKYYTIYDKERNKESFLSAFENLFQVSIDEASRVSVGDSCYTIIASIENDFLIALYKEDKNYIMTNNGKTYDNISYR